MFRFYFPEEESSQDVSDQIPGDGTDNEEVSSEEQPSSSEGRELDQHVALFLLTNIYGIVYLN
jgi:hypothetical protein